MLSPSGKIEWRCPNCNNSDIHYNKITPLSFYSKGDVLSYIPTKSGYCCRCNTYWPWRSRLKKSLSN